MNPFCFQIAPDLPDRLGHSELCLQIANCEIEISVLGHFEYFAIRKIPEHVRRRVQPAAARRFCSACPAID